MPAATEAPTRRPTGCPCSSTTASALGSATPARPVGLGPLLAVCGLAGGAGVTTLAYLIALAAARQLDDPVLVADTGGPSGGLAAFAGVEVPRSLAELAAQLAAGLPLGGGIYATGPAGLRVLATGPEFPRAPVAPQLTRILDDAREAHGLTVIDCGTLARDVDRTAAAAATHVAWVLPATRTRRQAAASGVLEAAPRMAAKELIVARATCVSRGRRCEQLRRIAAERRAPLVLVPHLTGLERGAARARASRRRRCPSRRSSERCGDERPQLRGARRRRPQRAAPSGLAARPGRQSRVGPRSLVAAAARRRADASPLAAIACGVIALTGGSPPRRAGGSRSRSPGSPPDPARRRASSSTTSARSRPSAACC